MSTAGLFELPPDERLELARRLVESVVAPETLNEEVLEGIRRIEDIASGRVQGLTEEEIRSRQCNGMKRKKAQIEKASAGTVLAVRARAEGNKWTDAEREKRGEQFMKLYSALNGLNTFKPGR